ncbi:hypothetical protein BUALT_Bualt14G0083600 [Buddleja alternifolia]|uniref:protein-serine/threonine phosphatase n=1 Tax=Buddleja alternifolia TaxID=168488 RepID=A0AAV6WRC0_9LAMI|nr:hypothetical protein BUALT_Bualt14G0083600 [Buddleja alternifolia]
MPKFLSELLSNTCCPTASFLPKFLNFPWKMGCIHGKCCSRYPPSSNGDNKEELGVTDGQNTHIIANSSIGVVDVPSHNFRLAYSLLSQRGFYPETPDKENQDSYCIRTNIQGNPNVHFFGVFDGHGLCGTQCSTFVKDRLVEILSNDATLLDDPVKAYGAAFLATNDELHNNSGIDDSMSGTTAITALTIGDKLYVANVGDSRAVLAVKEGNSVIAQDLSCDQTPFRKDECERVKLCGARVLSVDQVEGLKDPGIQSWGDEETEGGDPPRLWVQNGMYPGTAFTRSVGDSTAEKIGVVADPEVSIVQLTPSHPFFVVASDGVFEFLSSQTVVDMVNKYADPRDACSAIAGESYKLCQVFMPVMDVSREIPIDAMKEEGNVNTHVTPPGSEVFHSVGSDFFETQTSPICPWIKARMYLCRW